MLDDYRLVNDMFHFPSLSRLETCAYDGETVGLKIQRFISGLEHKLFSFFVVTVDH